MDKDSNTCVSRAKDCSERRTQDATKLSLLIVRCSLSGWETSSHLFSQSGGSGCKTNVPGHLRVSKGRNEHRGKCKTGKANRRKDREGIKRERRVDQTDCNLFERSNTDKETYNSFRGRGEVESQSKECQVKSDSEIVSHCSMITSSCCHFLSQPRDCF